MRVVHVIIRILKDINTQITIQSTVFLYVIDVQRGGETWYFCNPRESQSAEWVSAACGDVLLSDTLAGSDAGM